MRELKFRAWFYDGVNLSTGTMWPGGKAFSEDFIDFDDKDDNLLKPTDKCTIIMQYTGLKDCKNVEIYESDIIEAQIVEPPSVPTMGKIVWDTEYAYWGNKNCAGITPLYKLNDIKIIGNIYEHSHLLKDKQ